ncbi:hypothetical protein QQP08_005866 [Theobroma cacao]|nr:hypothetical protein QQP08_005866 [Theobroma cacao]
MWSRLRQEGYVVGDEFCVTPLIEKRADQDSWVSIRKGPTRILGFEAKLKEENNYNGNDSSSLFDPGGRAGHHDATTAMQPIRVTPDTSEIGSRSKLPLDCKDDSVVLNLLLKQQSFFH